MNEEERSETVEMFKKNFDDLVPEQIYKIKEDSDNLTPENIIGAIRSQVWKNITPEFYTIFWLLNLDNIYVPVERLLLICIYHSLIGCFF